VLTKLEKKIKKVVDMLSQSRLEDEADLEGTFLVFEN